jgi:hypothetical protein
MSNYDTWKMHDPRYDETPSYEQAYESEYEDVTEDEIDAYMAQHNIPDTEEERELTREQIAHERAEAQ